MASQLSPPSRSFLVTGVLCSVFLLSLLIFYDVFAPIVGISDGRNSKPIHEILRELDKGFKTVEFAEHESFEDLDHGFDALWSNVLTPNGGFIYTINKQKKRSKYGISMFHQLHCLEMLRMEMQYLHTLIDTLNTTTDRRQVQNAETRHVEHDLDPQESARLSTRDSEHVHDQHDAGHPLHCFDYLRQSLLCNADANLEPPRKMSNGQGSAIDGMGERKCKDWSILYTASEQSDKSPALLDMLLR